MICGPKNVVEPYEKRIEILHGRPFEGGPNSAQPAHTFWQKLAELAELAMPS